MQRFREQVRGYLSNDDIKDKKILEEAKSKIEKKMEDFKKCEQETKTKAYSKIGLSKDSTDPEMVFYLLSFQFIESIN